MRLPLDVRSDALGVNQLTIEYISQTAVGSHRYIPLTADLTINIAADLANNTSSDQLIWSLIHLSADEWISKAGDATYRRLRKTCTERISVINYYWRRLIKQDRRTFIFRKASWSFKRPEEVNYVAGSQFSLVNLITFSPGTLPVIHFKWISVN